MEVSRNSANNECLCLAEEKFDECGQREGIPTCVQLRNSFTQAEDMVKEIDVCATQKNI